MDLNNENDSETFCRNTNSERCSCWLQGETPACTWAKYRCDRVEILLITTRSSHLVLFFLIKCQHCYLTRIWGQSKLCFNPCCCGLHPNVLSAHILSFDARWLNLNFLIVWSWEQNATNQLRWKYDHTGRFRGAHRLRFSTRSLCFITGLRERLKLLTHRGTAKPLHIPIDHRFSPLQVAFSL